MVELVSPRQGDRRSLSETGVLALQEHWLRLPTTAPTSCLVARRFSRWPSKGLAFNPHSSRSGSVQRILSVVPAERIPSIRAVLAGGHHR